MSPVELFFLAFLFSFVGSIPPGTLNLTMIQLGMDHRLNTAWRFAIAAALIEYPYAWLAVEFESLLTSSTLIEDNFRLFTGLVMIVLGCFNIWSATKTGSIALQKINKSGFRRGVVLSLLNPLALLYWLGITAYLKSVRWIELDTAWQVHGYLLGVSMGALCLLTAMAYLARRLIKYLKDNRLVTLVPGMILIVLGLYALVKYIMKFL